MGKNNITLEGAIEREIKSAAGLLNATQTNIAEVILALGEVIPAEPRIRGILGKPSTSVYYAAKQWSITVLIPHGTKTQPNKGVFQWFIYQNSKLRFAGNTRIPIHATLKNCKSVVTMERSKMVWNKFVESVKALQTPQNDSGV